jgi:hypothetical protein
MSRGLGHVETAILEIIEDGEVHDVIDLAADTYTDIRHADVDYSDATRAERVAVLRAVCSLRRKHPRRIAVCGGEGRIPLCIGKPAAIRDLLQSPRAKAPALTALANGLSVAAGRPLMRERSALGGYGPGRP